MLQDFVEQFRREVRSARNRQPSAPEMLERIWSGWRSSYVSAAPVRSVGEVTEPGSVFTRLLSSGAPDEETHIVHRGDTCFVIMNAVSVHVRSPDRAAVP